MFDSTADIEAFDPELAAAMRAEAVRQEEHVELIASENYASPLVLEAQGSVLTNKYAEGYPGKRYYGGCEHVDEVERLAIDRAKALFGADYANVQPHSGSQANMAVYLALLQPGDAVLGMSLAHGGHLTHGAKPNFSGKLYNVAQYGVDTETGELDYAEIERLAHEHRPKMIVAGFSAYSRVMDWARFRRDRRRGRGLPVRRHGARRGPGRRGALPQPGAGGRRGHHDHPQDPARPARRADPGAEQPGSREEAERAGLPRHPGRPADARHRRQGRGLQGGAAARVQGVPRAGRGQRPRHGPTCSSSAATSSSPAAPTITSSSWISWTRRSPARPRTRPWAGRTSRSTRTRCRTIRSRPSSPAASGWGRPRRRRAGSRSPRCTALAGWICDILDDLGNETVIERVRGQVVELCRRFPVYGSAPAATQKVA